MFGSLGCGKPVNLLKMPLNWSRLRESSDGRRCLFAGLKDRHLPKGLCAALQIWAP